MLTNFSYQVIESVFDDSSASMGAAEAHGVLAGLLCVDERIDSRIWVSEVFDDIDNMDMLASVDRETFSSLFDETRRLLEDEIFEFDLLLPDDDTSLNERAVAFSDWCKGFLYGLGFGGEKNDWPGDCNELLLDIIEISRLDPEVEGDTDENAYMELTEFVRVAVQLFHNELRTRGIPEKYH